MSRSSVGTRRHRARSPGRLDGLCLALVVATWAGAAPGADFEQSFERLKAHASECTSKWGYDPDRGERLGPHEIGVGERDWRECVYQGVHDIMIPGSAVANAYRGLIARDKGMTERIAREELTREERKARLEKLLADIESSEKAASESAANSASEQDQLEKDRDRLRARMDELKKMRRIQSMMAR
jgi:hypothetical protein